MACFVCLMRKYYEKNFQFHFYSSYGMLMYKRLLTANMKMVLFHDEFHSCPVVLFPMMYELHSQTLRFFADML